MCIERSFGKIECKDFCIDYNGLHDNKIAQRNNTINQSYNIIIPLRVLPHKDLDLAKLL